MTYNERTMTLKIRRRDVCDLILACMACGELSGAEKWEQLHDKLLGMLDEFDAQNMTDTEK